MKRNTIRSASLVAAAVVISTFAVAAPAQARVQSIGQCTSGNVCGWHGADYAATFHQQNYTGAIPVAHRNLFSSVANRTTSTVSFWLGTSTTSGVYLNLGSGGEYRDLQGQAFNDGIEAIKIG